MNKKKIHIIGGGIIGLCSAWYLVKDGYQVTIIDKNDLTDGTSFGNAGMIVPSHFVPMATPGVITQGLKWLLNSKSPFYVKPRLDSELIQWLWHFYRSANTKKVKEAMPILYAFNQRSKELYRAIAANGDFKFNYEEQGLLMLYKTAKQAKKEAELAEKAHQLGIRAAILDNQDLKKLEPDMDLEVLGGIYFPGDAHLYPNQLMTQMVTKLRHLGVQFITGKTISDFKLLGGKIIGLLDNKGEVTLVSEVLLTAGSWTSQLLKKAGIKIFLQDGKGYSVTLKKPPLRPRIPTILTEAKVAITPMGKDLRIGGTLELSGLSPKINQKRVQGILESIPAYYKNISLPTIETEKVWKGFRPCTPDGLPYIGKSATISNLLVGTGHGMMGLSLGAATGKIISQLATGQKTMLDIYPFRLNRF